MERYRIFVSSPGDVGKERHLAERVIHRVAAEFQDDGEVETYFWEYEPMESTRDYQENIPLGIRSSHQHSMETARQPATPQTRASGGRTVALRN